MRLTRLEARGFRNLANLDLEVPAEGAVLLGANGQGKTSLLEAIAYPVLFRSFRTSLEAEVVRFGEAGFRVKVDERQEKIGYKIREAQLQKVPYMLVVGDREAADGNVAVRSRAGGDLGSQPLDAFLASAAAEVRDKK